MTGKWIYNPAICDHVDCRGECDECPHKDDVILYEEKQDAQNNVWMDEWRGRYIE